LNPETVFTENTKNMTIQVYEEKHDVDLETRTEQIKDIENNLQLVSEMYIKLGKMVVEQGELTMSIADKIDQSLVNVEDSQQEIIEWYRKVLSNRGLVLKIFLVLIVFIIFVGIFLL
jgi:syntaxin 5